MNHDRTSRLGPLAALALAAGASIALAACGGSSSSTSTTGAHAASTSPATATTSATATTPATGTPSESAQGLARYNECLIKHGVTLNSQGAPVLGDSASRATYRAALRACGGANLRVSKRLRTVPRTQSLKRFVACMRAHGQNLPEPNTSGKGPIFDTKGLDTHSSAFTTAARTCIVLAIERPKAGTTPAG
jgi:hypothetical protein